ncbi:hypothetical protein HN681_02625 [archaeon]|jgi:hypothetical protein|nr:hypothetical protein [archaeon]MBT3731188.1 hypothetical protein [archaeon]MBT4670058.1 hypothetical protein [archaeon]MBT5030651.1 hypothetical protein [archaeon]MBT5288003.1 hypothetical protein [archaeon]
MTKDNDKIYCTLDAVFAEDDKAHDALSREFEVTDDDLRFLYSGKNVLGFEEDGTPIRRESIIEKPYITDEGKWSDHRDYVLPTIKEDIEAGILSVNYLRPDLRHLVNIVDEE